jgi:hypothetical protein
VSRIQEGGSKSKNRRYARLLKYRLKGKKAEYDAEYVVPLPILPTEKVAGQSEIHFISDNQFLVLARDSGSGHGQDSSESIYRNADVFDISKATNIKNTNNDSTGGAIASSKGVLNADIVPAQYCPWLSFNNNDQLNRFGVHNGGEQDATLLNEKWESFALLPVDGKFRTKGDGDEYYLISVSDNDFITQNGQYSPICELYSNTNLDHQGYINSGKNKYADASGFNLDTQVLVFKVRLPKGAKPL